MENQKGLEERSMETKRKEDKFHMVVNTWLTLIFIVNIVHFVIGSYMVKFYPDLGYDIALNFCTFALVGSLLATKKKIYFILLLIFIVANAAGHFVVDPNPKVGILQLIVAALLMLVCLLKKNGHSAYDVMGF